MTDQALLNKVRVLAKKMEENTLYDYELSGYMKTKETRDIFRKSARHIVLQKKKHFYIDQANNGTLSEQGGSGRLMIQAVADARKNRAVYPIGSVFSIKGYGQKGHYLGDVDKQIKKFDEANATMIKGVMERARKNALMRK